MNLKTLVQKCCDNYPSLYQHRDEVLNHLYCVVGSGYSWNTEGSISGDRSEKSSPKRSQKKSLSEALPKPKTVYYYPISSKYSLAATVPDNVKQDYLDGAFEILQMIVDSPDNPHVPFESIPEDMRESWVKNARPESVLKQEEISSLHNKEHVENKKVAKNLISALEERFPGRKATGGKSSIPDRVEPYMYNSEDDLLIFDTGDKVEVTFRTGFRVPAKYAGLTLTFTVDNCEKYKWRIESKVLVLKSTSNPKDIIVVHPTDRFRCLMIDLFPCNRRPFAGWENKKVSIRKVL
jgi:hypothetical protein